MSQLSAMFKLKSEDWIKGLVVACGVAILGTLQQMVSGHGFDFASYDWSLIGNAVWMAFTAYLSKNFATDSNGKVLGKI